MYGSRDMKRDRQNVLSFWTAFCPDNLKSQNFEKLKKTPGDTIILHKCTKNHDHMLKCSWDMACDRCNCYFSLWAIFCPFTAQKIKVLQKWKTHLEISSFYICAPKMLMRWYTVPEKWCATDGWTDGPTNGWTEKVTYRGGCPT